MAVNNSFARGWPTFLAQARRQLCQIPPRAAASGRRAHQGYRVLAWSCRMDFARADASLMACSGRGTSMSFMRSVGMGWQWIVGQVETNS